MAKAPVSRVEWAHAPAAGIEPDPDFDRHGVVLRVMLPKEIPGTTIDLSS
jgi:hypothetical protein